MKKIRIEKLSKDVKSQIYKIDKLPDGQYFSSKPEQVKNDLGIEVRNLIDSCNLTIYYFDGLFFREQVKRKEEKEVEKVEIVGDKKISGLKPDSVGPGFMQYNKRLVFIKPLKGVKLQYLDGNTTISFTSALYKNYSVYPIEISDIFRLVTDSFLVEIYLKGKGIKDLSPTKIIYLPSGEFLTYIKYYDRQGVESFLEKLPNMIIEFDKKIVVSECFKIAEIFKKEIAHYLLEDPKIEINGSSFSLAYKFNKKKFEFSYHSFYSGDKFIDSFTISEASIEEIWKRIVSEKPGTITEFYVANSSLVVKNVSMNLLLDLVQILSKDYLINMLSRGSNVN